MPPGCGSASCGALLRGVALLASRVAATSLASRKPPVLDCSRRRRSGGVSRAVTRQSPMSLPDFSQLPLNEHRALVLHRQARRAVSEAWEAWEESANRYRQLVHVHQVDRAFDLTKVWRPPPEHLYSAAWYANRKLDAWLAAMAHEESVFQQVRDHLPSQGVLRPPAGRFYERFPVSRRRTRTPPRTGTTTNQGD